MATDGPVAHITLHHEQGHESALHFRAYTGQIAVNTPMSDTRPGTRPEPGPAAGEPAARRAAAAGRAVSSSP